MFFFYEMEIKVLYVSVSFYYKPIQYYSFNINTILSFEITTNDTKLAIAL